MKGGSLHPRAQFAHLLFLFEDLLIVSTIYLPLLLAHFSEFGSALVFGSVVDCKLAKGYSDFDQMIIFNRATLFNVNSLLFARKVVQNLNRYSVLFNTLHHHDAFVLTEVDYMFYPESVFPLFLSTRPEVQ